jgi:hypothetical protein
MQAPQSNSPVLTNEDTIGELQRLKRVMYAKYAEWDTKATKSGSRFLNSEHKLATAMSKFYKSLGEMAVAYGPPSAYDQKYYEVTKAQDALTAASQLSLEVRNQLDIDKSNVVFTVFAYIATREGDSMIVNFRPCRTASKVYFDNFGSRVSGFLQVSCRTSRRRCKAHHLQKKVVGLTGTHAVLLI